MRTLRQRLGLATAVLWIAAIVSAAVAGGTGATSGGDYAAQVTADGPRAYWRLGETSGTTAADETASASPGTYAGGVVLGVPASLAGDPDTAVRFDGVDD